jgi:hypothetical protein
MTKKILVVEGEGDKRFGNEVLAIHMMKDIEIFPPKSIRNDGGNGINNLIDVLGITLKQAQTGTYEKIGVCVDADSPRNDGGFRNRRQQILDVFNEYGFSPTVNSVAQVEGKGDILRKANSQIICGVWVMPSHKSDGYMESLLINCVSDEELMKLVKYSEKVVARVEPKLFSDHHTEKAHLATFLALQERCGIPFDAALRKNIFDAKSERMQNFVTWLKTLFS